MKKTSVQLFDDAAKLAAELSELQASMTAKRGTMGAAVLDGADPAKLAGELAAMNFRIDVSTMTAAAATVRAEQAAQDEQNALALAARVEFVKLDGVAFSEWLKVFALAAEMFSLANQAQVDLEKVRLMRETWHLAADQKSAVFGNVSYAMFEMERQFTEVKGQLNIHQKVV